MTEETGTGDPWVGMRNVWADYDRDGDLDFYSHNFVQRTLYQNDGNVFFDVNESSGAGVEMSRGTGAAWGDYDNDGWPDLLITEVFLGSDKTLPNRLYLFRNAKDGTFEDVTEVAGLIRPRSRPEFWDAAFADYDNDGDLDLYVGVDGPNLYFLNNGDGTFTDIAPELGLGLGLEIEGKDVIWGDYDNDGDLDLYVVQRNAVSEPLVPNILFRNDGGTNNWLQVDLRGTISNLDAIGAKIVVAVGDTIQYREINGGTGFFSQHTRIQQFGLGDAKVAEEVRISWPSGLEDVLTNVAANTLLTVFEGETVAAPAPVVHDA